VHPVDADVYIFIHDCILSMIYLQDRREPGHWQGWLWMLPAAWFRSKFCRGQNYPQTWY